MKPNYYLYFFVTSMPLIVTIVSSDDYPVYDLTFMQDLCLYNKLVMPGQGGWRRYGVIKADSDSCYEPNQDCSIYLNTTYGYHITMRFQYIAIDCNDGVLTIEGETGPTSYCSFYTPSYSIYSTSNWLRYRFQTKTVLYCQGGFSFYYTTYHTGECTDDEFRCAIDGRCIPEELKCDLFDNCGDWSDERSGTCGLTTGAIAAISVTCALVGLSCLAFIIYCIYDKKHRRHHDSTHRRGSGNRCAPEPSTTVPIGPPTYVESPPDYTYINSVYSGVYEDIDYNKAPPTYQSISNNNSYPN